MVRKGCRRVKKSRKDRCESADSGVDTTLNNRTFQPVQCPYNEFNGLEEELDFEPEGDGDLVNNTTDHSMFNHSTIEIVDSDCKENDERSVSSISIQSSGHRKDMLPVPRIDAKDGRQNMYFPFTYSNSSRILLDSSSDESCSSGQNINTETEDDTFRSFEDSGDFYNTEQDSDCNLSQEEEDKLLYGSEEEEEEPEVPQIDKRQVAVCQFGNVRITLPTFNNNVPEETCDQDYKKRTNRSGHLNSTDKVQRKRKWNLHYTPEVLPMQVFLNDIGYIPPYHESESGDSDSSSITAPNKKLFVICKDKDKIVCEKSADELQREMSFAKTVDSTFKMPLPPVKRPPTRPKRTVCNSNQSNSNLQIQVVNKSPEVQPRQPSFLSSTNRSSFSYSKESDVDKDDTISLIASTIGDHNEDPTEDFSSVESSFVSPSTSEKDVTPPAPTYYAQQMVENWIQSVPNEQSSEISAPQTDNGNDSPSFEGVNLIPPEAPNGFPKVYFKDIPPIFVGLCFHHYFNGLCNRQSCMLMHYVSREKYTGRFQNSSPEQLKKGYWLALKYTKLFKEIYPCFLIAFGTLKMHNELMTSIKDLLQISHINAMEALETVVQSFVDSGIPFLDTIERISFNVGFLQYPILADILLDLITRKPNIAENWEVISRIAKARGHISPDIAGRILNKVTSVYPINKELCIDIYSLLVKSKMTDLAQISVDVLAPFRAIVGFRELEDGPPPPAPQPVHPIVRLPANDGAHLLAAHIDSNLMKQWQRCKLEAVNRLPPPPTRPAPPEDPFYFHGYNYRTGQGYDNRVTDADERYFPADERYFAAAGGWRDSMAAAFSGKCRTPGSNMSAGSGSSYEDVNPNTVLHFEPPEVSEYVPETVRRVVDTRTPPAPSFSPLFGTPPEPPLPPPANLTLTPTIPIFGNPQYRKDFKFDVSLHNLVPNLSEEVNINESDVALLNLAILSKNGTEFYRLLEFYKPLPTIRNFVTMTLANFRSCNSGMYDLLVDLIDALELVKPDFAKDLHIKVIFEVVIMNILFEMEKRGHWDKARKLLERFCDWDSLISSQIFPRKVSHMGRYLFLAKVFAKGKNYHFTSEILQCPSLHLLESLEKWPYTFDPHVDLKARNAVLTDFFHEAYMYNIADYANMYRRIYKHSAIAGYDACSQFNPMLIALINRNQVSLLKHFFPDMDVYSKVMDKHVLRAFTILLSDQLSRENVFKLYDVCCDKQIYTYYTGRETSIILRTNMLDKEIELILSYYMEKMARGGHPPPGDLLITIKLFESNAHYPKMLQSCVRSVLAINDKVKQILINEFGICVKDTSASKSTVVEVSLELLKEWLLCTQRRFLPTGAC